MRMTLRGDEKDKMEVIGEFGDKGVGAIVLKVVVASYMIL